MYVEYGYHQPECRDREERQALARAMPFSAADLALNQQGRLSAGQRVRLLGRAAHMVGELLLHAVPAMFLTGILAVLAIFGPDVLGFTAGRRPLRFAALLWVLVTGVGGLLLTLSGVLGRATGLAARLLHLAGDLCDSAVSNYCGRVSTNRSAEVDGLMPSENVACFVYANDRKYELSQAAYDELEALGGAGYYVIYFTTRSHFLLAMEPVRSVEAGDPTRNARP